MLNNPQIPIQTANYLCVINASQQLFYYWWLTWVLHNTVQTHWALSYYSQDILKHTTHNCVYKTEHRTWGCWGSPHTHTLRSLVVFLESRKGRNVSNVIWMYVTNIYALISSTMYSEICMTEVSDWVRIEILVFDSACHSVTSTPLVKVGRIQVNSIPCT